MAYLDSHGLQTLFTKLKVTFAKGLGITTGDSKVTIKLKDGAATPNDLASVDINAATSSAAGVMSKADKSKLDGIDAGANNYVHPTTSGNKHIPAGGTSGQILGWSADGTAIWITAPQGVTVHSLLTNLDFANSGHTGFQAEITNSNKLAYSLISGTPTIPDELKDLSDDATHRLVTDTEKSTWSGKQDVITFNTAYSASTNKAATMSDIESAMAGTAKYKGTIASEAAFVALTNYKVGDYYIASATFTHATGSGNITIDSGNMIFVKTAYASAYSAADFDIIQTDIEAIPDSEINNLS